MTWTSSSRPTRPTRTPGSIADSEASAFNVMWTDLANATKTGDKKKKIVTKAFLDERAGIVRGREALEEVVRFVGDEGGDLPVAAEMYDALETKAAKADAFENENTVLKGEVVELQAKIDALEAKSPPSWAASTS